MRLRCYGATSFTRRVSSSRPRFSSSPFVVEPDYLFLASLYSGSPEALQSALHKRGRAADFDKLYLACNEVVKFAESFVDLKQRLFINRHMPQIEANKESNKAMREEARRDLARIRPYLNEVIALPNTLTDSESPVTASQSSVSAPKADSYKDSSEATPIIDYRRLRQTKNVISNLQSGYGGIFCTLPYFVKQPVVELLRDSHQPNIDFSQFIPVSDGNCLVGNNLPAYASLLSWRNVKRRQGATWNSIVLGSIGPQYEIRDNGTVQQTLIYTCLELIPPPSARDSQKCEPGSAAALSRSSSVIPDLISEVLRVLDMPVSCSNVDAKFLSAMESGKLEWKNDTGGIVASVSSFGQFFNCRFRSKIEDVYPNAYFGKVFLDKCTAGVR